MKGSSFRMDSHDSRLLFREWLVTNGLGGFACGSILGIPMRKYDSLLNAALKPPFGRTTLLNYVADALILSDGREVSLSSVRIKGQAEPSYPPLAGFRLESNLPVWLYEFEDIHLEKTIWMAHGQNTTYVRYHLLKAKGPIDIRWRPYIHFRTLQQPLHDHLKRNCKIQTCKEGYEIHFDSFPYLKLFNDQEAYFSEDFQILENVFYEIEEKRGYESTENLLSPGFFLSPLHLHETMAFVASIEPWHVLKAMSAEEAWIAERQRQKSLLRIGRPLSYSKVISQLILAADQFIITPISREADIVRLKASGEDARSIIAGYPWFTDWGRDTMISLEGLTLTTGRYDVAHAILRTFAHYIRDGLVPNMFPDGENEGLYHTADATLWFFHAVDRYLSFTDDEDFLEFILPKFQNIIESHLKATRFGICMDEKDGLLIQGEEGYQLTWMDAKVGDWVVTPRRGKAVEINALWYNALKLMELWTGKASPIAKLCYESFNEKFWYSDGGYLYDVIDGKEGGDPALRPNQLFAISLRFPVLKTERWKSVVDVAKKELLTARGMRTLSQSHPDFKAYYEGDLWARDAAYHQGTVWPWLIGPFMDAWLKVYPDEIDEAKQFLASLEDQIHENCMGTLGEIYDASDPFHARGCFAQAWSVAEFLRLYVKTHPEFQG